MALKRDPKSLEHFAAGALPEEGKAGHNHNVVFLPFSESHMTAPNDQKDQKDQKDKKARYLSCWQRPATKSLATSNNYPTFATGQERATPMLVPLDRSSMSLCVLRNGRWERIDQE